MGETGIRTVGAGITMMIAVLVKAAEDVDFLLRGMSCIFVLLTFGTVNGVLFGVVLFCILKFMACNDISDLHDVLFVS